MAWSEPKEGLATDTPHHAPPPWPLALAKDLWEEPERGCRIWDEVDVTENILNYEIFFILQNTVCAFKQHSSLPPSQEG